LNVGVDNQITWPREEQLIRFDKYQFVLMPKTKDHIQSIHVDPQANRLTMEDALTIINRFLSLLTWCDDQFAIAEGGWGGQPDPGSRAQAQLGIHNYSSLDLRPQHSGFS